MNYTHTELSSILEVLYPAGGWSVKDAVIIKLPKGTPSPSPAQMATAFAAYQSRTQQVLARAEAIGTLRQQWDSLPAWINGPYRPLFDAANRLLDEGSDEAAFEMIDAVEPTAKITNDPEKSAIFAVVKAQFLAAIESL